MLLVFNVAPAVPILAVLGLHVILDMKFLVYYLQYLLYMLIEHLFLMTV